uniref:Uncharacterized protein n=1 Tax=Plectus sambesii TaxID=2011161 RepID=A0A914XE59_9BILA
MKLFTGVVCLFALCAVTFAQPTAVNGQAGANTRQAEVNSQTGVQQPNTGSGLIPGAGVDAQVPGVAGLGVNLGRKRRDAEPLGAVVNGQLPGTQVAGSAQQSAVQAPVGSQVGVETPVGGAGLGVGRKRRQVDSQVGVGAQPVATGSQFGVNSAGSQPVAAGSQFGAQPVGAQPVAAGTQVGATPVGTQPVAPNVAPLVTAGDVGGRKRRGVNAQVGVGSQPLPVNAQGQAGVNGANTQTGANVQG